MNRELVHKVSAGAFEARYAASDDPWSFETSPYELRRYDSLLRALSKPHYEVIYEPACSIGVLTARLAGLANRVIATDIAPSAVKRARERCRGLHQVQIHCDDVATFVPEAALDLIVFSELGYYFEAQQLGRIASSLAGHLKRGGEFVAVHWLGDSGDHLLHGDEVHATLRSCLPLTWTHGERHAGFRLDSWVRR